MEVQVIEKAYFPGTTSTGIDTNGDLSISTSAERYKLIVRSIKSQEVWSHTTDVTHYSETRIDEVITINIRKGKYTNQIYK